MNRSDVSAARLIGLHFALDHGVGVVRMSCAAFRNLQRNLQQSPVQVFGNDDGSLVLYRHRETGKWRIACVCALVPFTAPPRTYIRLDYRILIRPDWT